MSIDPRAMAEFIRLQMTNSVNPFSDSLYGESNAVDGTSDSGGDFMQVLQSLMQQQQMLASASNTQQESVASSQNSAMYQDPATMASLGVSGYTPDQTNSYYDPFAILGDTQSGIDPTAAAISFGNVIPARTLLQNLKPLEAPLGYANAQVSNKPSPLAPFGFISGNSAPTSPTPTPSSTKSNSITAPSGPTGYNGLIEQASTKFGVSSSLIKAVIQAESGYNSKAVSHAGAQGLMQLMPRTAASLGVKDSFDPQQNIMGGTKYLAQLLRRFNGEEAVAIAAYNAGPGRVSRLGISNTEQLRDKFLLLPRETQKYVDKVLGFKQNYV